MIIFFILYSIKMPRRNRNKISLSALKQSMTQPPPQGESKQPPHGRRGRSRERRQSRSPSISDFSDDASGAAFDVEQVFEALYSCDSKDDVILSTTLFENGVLPEFLEWALAAYEAIERKRAAVNAAESKEEKKP